MSKDELVEEIVGEKFEVWSDDGKYYYKGENCKDKREVSYEEFRRLLEEETVYSIGFTQNDSLGIRERLDAHLEHKKNETSEFGRRVKVVLVEEDQVVTQEGVNVSIKMDVLDEETEIMDDDLYSITMNVEGITGSVVDAGIYLPELYRSTFQVSYNGFLDNEEEIRAVRTAFNEDKHEASTE